MLIKIKPALFVIITLCLMLINTVPTSAVVAKLFNRSLSIGSSLGGVTTSHEFSFAFSSVQNVGSVVFQYCNDPIEEVACVAPAGLNATSAVLTSQSGEAGFAIVSASTNQLVLGRTPANTGLQQNTYHFDNIVNPSNIGPFFVRIIAYSSSDGSGPEVAFNAVAGSITQGISVSTEVPDILYFCAAVLIPTDCSDASGDFIEFGTLSAADTRFGTSQFLVGTNAANGYTVATNGFTMTSGSKTIPGVNPLDTSRTGVSQFGINLATNAVPPAGGDPTGAAAGTIMPNYSVPNRFFYQDGDVIARALGRSDEEKFTVTYIVNVKPTQGPGVYNTTITYLCLAGF